MPEMEESPSSKAREEIVQLKRRIEQMEQPRKSLAVAYILLLLFGSLGFHRFYFGYEAFGVIQLTLSITGAVVFWYISMLSGIIILVVLGLWLLLDIFLLPRMIRKAERSRDMSANASEQAKQALLYKQRSKHEHLEKEQQALWLYLNDKYGEGNVKCPYCQRPISRVDGTAKLDYKTPMSDGGIGSIDNLHYICSTCSLEKGDKFSHEEFMRMKATERQNGHE